MLENDIETELNGVKVWNAEKNMEDDYFGLKYTDGVFSYLRTNDRYSTQNEAEITQYIRLYTYLTYEGKVADARTTNYTSEEGHTITIPDQDYSAVIVKSITYNESEKHYDYSYVLKYDSREDFSNSLHFKISSPYLEGNDDIGYYIDMPYCATGAIFRWYFHEWDGITGAALE